MIRGSTMLWLALAGALALGLFRVKHEAQRLEAELMAMEQAIVEHQEAIQVLEAEFSYLTRPERIARLARQYLELEPLEAESLAAFSDLPWRGDDSPAPETPDAIPSGIAKAFLASAEAGR